MLEIRLGRLRHRAGVRIFLEQRGRDFVDALVGRLRRHDRRGEQLERRAEIQLGERVRMLLEQQRHDRGGLLRRLECTGASGFDG